MSDSFWADNFWATDFWASGFWQTDLSDTAILNADATTSVVNNYESCSRSGFRQYPNELIRDGYNSWVRKKSYDARHPQDLVKSTVDKQPGSVSPEQEDRFISEDIDPSDL